MASVRLRIDKYLEGERMMTGAVVDIRRLDVSVPGGTRVARTSVPIGESATRQLDLPPGRYEFTAILPSGEVLSQVADVDARPEGVPVFLAAAHSPREWLSWQHALGRSVGAARLYAAQARGGKPGWMEIDRVLAEWTPVPVSAQGADPVMEVVAGYLAQGPVAPRRPLTLPGGPPTRLPGMDAPPFRAFRLPPARTFDYRSAGFARHYLRVVDDAQRQILCVLPYPWRSSEGTETAVEVLVGPDQPVDAEPPTEHPDVPWSVSTVARDDHVASILGYFAAGDTSAAAFLAGTALDLLFRKMTNPLAASAGAYVLIDQWLRERSAARPEWVDWIENLARWFRWLPDGELLRGWVALAGPPGQSHVQVARGAFVEAIRRGIPFYTAGVRRLEEGLARIANQDRADGRTDPAVLHALERVRALAWNADPRSPFTTLRLWVETT